MIDRSGEYSVFSTEMGWMGVASTDRGVFASILPQETVEKAEAKLLTRIPFECYREDSRFIPLVNSLQAYFRGEPAVFKCEIDWSWATPFQRRVLEVVGAIPRGSYLTYGEVACLSGSPHAARAVGGALGANMIPVIIPCHRVIRSNGILGGFTGAGLEVKAHLLFLEGVVGLRHDKKETRD